jgi:hypothetical protein
MHDIPEENCEDFSLISTIYKDAGRNYKLIITQSTDTCAGNLIFTSF